VRTTGRPEVALRDVVAAVRGVDSTLPIGSLQTVEQARGKVLAPNRVITLLLSLFAAVAFAITAVGMSGVTASSVAERIPEIGVRTALGAGRESVLRLMLRRSMGLALAGLVLGVIGALALTRLLSSVIYGIASTDLLTYATVSLVLMGVVGLAAWLPARRATRVDPVVALRLE
jgi:putative ABC transport system permease protein